MQQISHISEKKKQEIIKALEDRGAKLPCPRCGNQSFTLLDGYFNQTIQTDVRGLVLGGPSVPSVVVVCNRCGYLSQHALGALGLLPKEEAENE
jgi:ribosomal protein L37E